MSTTSLKLPEDVKQLAVAAAKQQGVTPHAFMVDAIRVAAVAAEKRAAFVADAVASRAETLGSGKGYSADEVHVLENHPLVGRPAEHEMRELVVSRGRTGYLALYSYDEAHDTVLVLAIRRQRAAGFGRLPAWFWAHSPR